MQKVLTASEMKEVDRLTTERFATPSLLLMEAAAGAAASAIIEKLARTADGLSVLILCGRGNNGGDGAALARTLHRMGAVVDLVLVGAIENTKGEAKINLEIVRRLAAAQRSDNGPSFEVEFQQPTRPGPLKYVEWSTIEDLEDALGENLFDTCDVIVDALFGTGLSRPVKGLEQQVISRLVQVVSGSTRIHRPLIVSLDVPSGLNADSASVIGDAIRADLTISFTAPKVANVLPPASDLGGQLVIANIGSPGDLVDATPSKLFVSEMADARRWLIRTRYTRESYKNSHGHVLVIAGSRGFSGAGVLCSEAAMGTGAGLVTVATPFSAQSAVASRVTPEVMVSGLEETESGSVSFSAFDSVQKLAIKASVIAIGPGLSSNDEETRRFVRSIVNSRKVPVVLDADALNSLAPWPEDLQGSPSLPLILTPHAGEMMRLLGRETKDALRERVNVVREFAINHRVILVLKGSRTVIASTDGRVFINPTGNPGLGTAGSGDTLTGIIAGFLSQELALFGDEADALSACVAAVYIAGMAGDLAAREVGMRGMIASDIRRYLTRAIVDVDATGELP